MVCFIAFDSDFSSFVAVPLVLALRYILKNALDYLQYLNSRRIEV